MKKIVLSSKNKGKIKEIRELLKGLSVEILTLEDFPSVTLPPEDGKSFRENALKKARFVASMTGVASLSDDSGLKVDALGGMPGVVSARYAGRNAADEENNAKLLEELKGVPLEKRTARFECVAAFAEPSGNERTFEGTVEGIISTAPKGKGGFGYDPVFFIPSMNKTFAELTADEKNKISHRGKALKKLEDWLKRQGQA